MHNLNLNFTYNHINPRDYVGVFQDPLWYLNPPVEFKEYVYGSKEGKDEIWLAKREELKLMLGEFLREGLIALGESGINHDAKRLPIDTIVVHHTSTESDTPLERIDSAGFLGMYVAEHLNKKREYYGTPVWSGHFYQGRQVFIPYHYLIWPDGKVINALKDEYIGWHAGDWDMNCRSIAISFVEDLTDKAPSNQALKAAQAIIANYRLQTPELAILGHREVVDTTACPGNKFLGESGWKKLLISPD